MSTRVSLSFLCIVLTCSAFLAQGIATVIRARHEASQQPVAGHLTIGRGFHGEDCSHCVESLKSRIRRAAGPDIEKSLESSDNGLFVRECTEDLTILASLRVEHTEDVYREVLVLKGHFEPEISKSARMVVARLRKHREESK